MHQLENGADIPKEGIVKQTASFGIFWNLKCSPAFEAFLATGGTEEECVGSRV